VQLILAGHPTANIAERLGITVGTVENHRRTSRYRAERYSPRRPVSEVAAIAASHP